MIVTTTNQLEGKKIEQYLGIVVGEAVMGANIFKDIFASIRDIVGGRSGAYEDELTKARKIGFQELMKFGKATSSTDFWVDCSVF